MNINLKDFQQLTDYDNVLVVDENGIIIFNDLADLNVLKEIGLRPEEFMGKHITSSYMNLSHENSTIMNVLKNGKAVCNVKQELIMKNGNLFVTINSTYPIKDNEKIIGAIEFSKHFYTKENIQSLDKFASHKVYRRNNTIYTIDNIISVNPKMEAIKNKIKKIAMTNSTVLINGKTGTGKEMIAQSIHNLSDRYGGPFISLNCGAVPPNLFESTLFGTVKGSFTGAIAMPGLFEQAEGGTLFLDEINSLDFYLQVKLLKAIEEKVIRRIGGDKNISVDIRVISATNEDPDVLVAEKRLREDLFYRLGVVQIDLPTLAERKEDIEKLLEYYIDFYNNNMNIYIEGCQPEVIECFNRYPWPGNIRELKNAVETAYNNVSTNHITLEDIPKRMREYNQSPPSDQMDNKIESLKEAVEKFEKELIMKELSSKNGKLTETAKQLGLSKQLLKYKIEKYQLG
ncbi:sigma-54-dependent Fis family transcriptional regulator [Bacillus sp. ISL-46]|uniref:sigma-54 interaction domain-containing protein n=1 Tax=Bacillus sp. ISL-46 TaxID=2819129 RepID=UPI001BE7E2B6|nr:sigma 54-interacting transcriptional regulator [Bacillus sp. ISL-46]MBT2725062.1 sigma 54-interacting transcriptional regulator [Bacillus sp. ISL-46]